MTRLLYPEQLELDGILKGDVVGVGGHHALVKFLMPAASALVVRYTDTNVYSVISTDSVESIVRNANVELVQPKAL